MIGTRDYSNNYVLQNVFNYEYLPDTDAPLKAFAKKILSPKILCVEADCDTKIGRRVSTLTSIEGLIELGTNQIISESTVSSLLSVGTYYVRVRDGSTCTSNGVCSLCYYGSSARYGAYDSGIIGSYMELTGDAASYQNFLANTYSGSLLGYKVIPADPLPYHYTLWSTITNHREMDGLCNRLKGVPPDELEYLKSIQGHLERALMIIAYYGVYSG
jgi:hypothetical protein